MAFELLQKMAIGRQNLSPKTLSICKSTVRLSKDLTKYFEEKDCVEIYIDKKNLQIGCKPSNDSIRGFKVFLNKGTAGNYISFSVAFLRTRIELGHYPITIDKDGMLIFSVKEITEPNQETIKI